MRHHRKIRPFGRDNGQRAALLRSLARNLINEGSIKTTTPKAKELRPFIERIVTKAKVDTLASHRYVIERLGTKPEAKKLMKDIAPRFADRKGGYTRIVKLPNRVSDGSPMAVIEFVA